MIVLLETIINSEMALVFAVSGFIFQIVVAIKEMVIKIFE